jgi:intracellular sulfur oxidation DsrE/DsrF family protein
MNLALNNVTNIIQYYRDKGETVDVAVVAYGPGLNMYRDDKSPVKDRLKQISEMAFPSNVKFAACGNTKKNMEKKEGHSIALVPQASVVPSGVVTLSELQEKGWTYIKP